MSGALEGDEELQPNMRMIIALFDDPEHWRARAEETRALADMMATVYGRDTMRRVADEYDKLADHAEQRRANKVAPFKSNNNTK